MKKLVQYVQDHWQQRVCRNTIRRVLKRAGLSWKKCKKLLGKANPAKREEYLKTFLNLYEQMCGGEVRLIYMDESHFHRDLALGYNWSVCGERCWVVSDCPGLSEKINWYGAYDFQAGQCLIWNEGNCNTEHTMDFLEQVRTWLGAPSMRDVIIWDGAPWHRANRLMERAEELGFEILQLPGYSPDLNPIEGLWKWMRETITHHYCHQSVAELFEACKQFIDQINQSAQIIVQKLWPRFSLDEECEKLRFSN